MSLLVPTMHATFNLKEGGFSNNLWISVLVVIGWTYRHVPPNTRKCVVFTCHLKYLTGFHLPHIATSFLKYAVKT